ncbi:hypothetical protein, partial [Phocaeicola plebeius]
TQGRFQLNASAFEVKRLYVLIKTYLHFSSNTSAFFQASSRTKKIRELSKKNSLIVCHTDDSIIPSELLQKDKRQHKFHILCKRPD